MEGVRWRHVTRIEEERLLHATMSPSCLTLLFFLLMFMFVANMPFIGRLRPLRVCRRQPPALPLPPVAMAQTEQQSPSSGLVAAVARL